jgi:SAM-dependent methyltransferase
MSLVRSAPDAEMLASRVQVGHARDDATIASHRARWAQKPVLARVYAVWFESVLGQIPHAERVLEIGAGPGFFSQYAQHARPDLRWLASDYLRVSGNDLVADALQLPVRDSSVGAVVGFDVLHHLVRPARFFAEAARVLQPGGRILLVEPWLSPLSYPLYRLFHHEGCRLRIDPWQPFAAQHSHSKEAFEGDAAVAWKLIRVASVAQWDALGLCVPEVQTLNGFAYLATLGFYQPCLLPRGSSARTLIRLDRWLKPAARLLGVRARLTWRRR